MSSMPNMHCFLVPYAKWTLNCLLDLFTVQYTKYQEWTIVKQDRYGINVVSVHVNPDNLFIKKFTMTPVNIFIKANAYYFTGIQGILVFNPLV